jgi:hypothetical protein
VAPRRTKQINRRQLPQPLLPTKQTPPRPTVEAAATAADVVAVVVVLRTNRTTNNKQEKAATIPTTTRTSRVERMAGADQDRRKETPRSGTPHLPNGHEAGNVRFRFCCRFDKTSIFQQTYLPRYNAFLVLLRPSYTLSIP